MAENQTHPPSSIRHPHSRSLVLAVIKLLLTLIVVAFVAVALVKQFHAVRWEQMRFQPALAAAGVIAMLGVNACQLVTFRGLLAGYGQRLPWRTTLTAAWVPPLGKYVPGKVASIAGAVYLLRSRGVPGAVALGTALMLDGLAVLAGLITSTPLLLWEPVRKQMPYAWIGCIVLVAAGAGMLHPRVFVRLINFLLRRLKRSPLPAEPTVRSFLLPAAASFGQWFFAGLGLWLMTRALIVVSPALLPLFIAVAALAMTVSYLALFAPGGIGVREWLYLVTLGPVVGASAAIVIVAMRVIQTLIELSLAGVGMWLLRSSPDAVTVPCEAQR